MAEPLAQSYHVIAVSPDPSQVWAGTPALARLPSGRLVACYEWFRRGVDAERIPNQTEILVSDDRGKTWGRTTEIDIIWPSLFTYGHELYAIGSRRKSREAVITRSSDGGQTFTPEQTLFEGRFHNSATHVLIKDSWAYRAYEACEAGAGRSQWRSLVVAGDLSRDLLDRDSWRMSPQLEFPGVPDLLQQHFYEPSVEDKIPETCWLEGNVIAVRGDIRVVLRTTIDAHSTAGLAAICRLEDDGTELRYRFVQFHPMPGAQCKFSILYDEPSGLFWTTVTRPTDPWQDRGPLKARGFFGAPGNERRILMLMYSLDALNWFDAGCVAMSPHPLDSFSYASQIVDADDLLVLARTSQGGLNQHDTNLITLHRVRRFRDLALKIHADLSWRQKPPS